MNQLVLDDRLATGLYAVRSESATVFVLRWRGDVGESHVRRLPGHEPTLRLQFDGWWLPLRGVGPEGADYAGSLVEIVTRTLWLHQADPRRFTIHPAWILQRRVIAIEPIDYEQMRTMANERGWVLPPWTHGQDQLLTAR